MEKESKLYASVFGFLVVLTILTVAAYFVGQGGGRVMAVTVALSIASVKALLIALYFMHVKDEHLLIQGIALVGIVAVVILAVGIFPDIGLRVAG